MRRIDLETGNVNTNNMEKFFLVKDKNVVIGNVNHIAVFPTDQWNTFVKQVQDSMRRPSVSIWQMFKSIFTGDSFDRIKSLQSYPESPLGIEEMRHVLKDACTSTPAYQLFLASIDIADRYLFEENEKKYLARTLVSYGMVYSVHGGNGIYLMDDEWIRNREAVDELVKTNRLVRLIFDNSTVRYYLPYATPFVPELSKPAQQEWDTLLNCRRQWRFAAR